MLTGKFWDVASFTEALPKTTIVLLVFSDSRSRKSLPPMHSTHTSSAESSSPRPAAWARRIAAARMPIEEPLENTEAAVEKLRQCPSTELRRARTHHRRVLTSLQNGGYSTLSDATRERLADQLRRNLEALNRALASDADEKAPASTMPPGGTDEEDALASLGSRLRALLERLW